MLPFWSAALPTLLLMFAALALLLLVHSWLRFSPVLLVVLGALIGGIGGYLTAETSADGFPLWLTVVFVAGGAWIGFLVFWTYTRALRKRESSPRTGYR